MFHLIVNEKVKHTSTTKRGCLREMQSYPRPSRYVEYVPTGVRTVDGSNWTLDGVTVEAPPDPPEIWVEGERTWTDGGYAGLCAND